MLFSTPDVLLWTRCRRQWLRRCVPWVLSADTPADTSSDNESVAPQPLPPLPTEMTGEANLRESARVIADSLAVRARDPVHVYPLTDERPPVAMFPVLSRDEAAIATWAEATTTAIAARREFVHGVLIAGDSVVLVDHGVYHKKIDAYEFALYRPATGVRGMYYTEAALVARAADVTGIPLGGLHLYYLRKELPRNAENTGGGATGADVYLESNLLKRARKGTQRVAR